MKDLYVTSIPGSITSALICVDLLSDDQANMTVMEIENITGQNQTTDKTTGNIGQPVSGNGNQLFELAIVNNSSNPKVYFLIQKKNYSWPLFKLHLSQAGCGVTMKDTTGLNSTVLF